jgi:hypothetical protein
MVEIIKNNGRYNFFKRMAKNEKTGEKRLKILQYPADLTNFYSFLAQN